jgi:hypothetical protein
MSFSPMGQGLNVMFNVLDESLKQTIDILKYLCYSPVVQRAVETGAVCLGPIQTGRFDFSDTYTGKRKISQTIKK